jgi:hypothetical protein
MTTFLRNTLSTCYPDKGRIYSYRGWYKYTHKWNYSKGSGGYLEERRGSMTATVYGTHFARINFSFSSLGEVGHILDSLSAPGQPSRYSAFTRLLPRCNISWEREASQLSNRRDLTREMCTPRALRIKVECQRDGWMIMGEDGNPIRQKKGKGQ